MAKATYDLYSLNQNALSLKNDDFYRFVGQVAGEVEASVLKVQGIQNARSFIRSNDLFDVFKLDCDELNEIKKNVSWQCSNGNYVVKQGIALNLQILKELLNDEHEKYVKKIHRQRKSSLSILSPLTASTLNEINPISNGSSSNTSTLTQKSDLSNMSSTEVTEKPIQSIRVVSDSVNHFDIINSMIEKYSKRCFESVVLKYNENYRLSMMKQDERMKVILHCQCGTQVSIYQRDQSSSFVLSNYYAHLSQSTCSMARKILQYDRTTSINTDSSTNTQNQSSTSLFYDETENSNTMLIDTNQSSSSISTDRGVIMKTNTNKRKSIEASSSLKRYSVLKKRRKKSN